MESERTIQDLKQKQALPLNVKVMLTKSRIRQWINAYGEDGVYVSFSGGKDSTVLLNIVREDYPNVKAVFVDTGLEYPEIREFVCTFDNVDILKPSKNFKQVIKEYGYPVISKQVSKRVHEYRNALKKGKDVKETEAYKEFNGERLMFRDGYDTPALSFYNKRKWKFLIYAPFLISNRCCDIMKKKPFHIYSRQTKRVPITAQMADESINREKLWLLHGCNAFDAKNPISNPMSFWTEQDVLRYIKENNIDICNVSVDVVEDYTGSDELPGQLDLSDFGFMEDKRKLKTTGCSRTGCMFCGYGCHLEKPGEGRFERMKVTHPAIYDYIMRPTEKGGLGYKYIIDWINDNSDLHIRY